MGLGTTQLYNKLIVYNHKRRGEFVVGGRTYSFRVRKYFPHRSVAEEFLLVDLVNNLDELAEDREMVLLRVKEKAKLMSRDRLRRAIAKFATAATKKYFEGLFASAA